MSLIELGTNHFQRMTAEEKVIVLQRIVERGSVMGSDIQVFVEVVQCSLKKKQIKYSMNMICCKGLDHNSRTIILTIA